MSPLDPRPHNLNEWNIAIREAKDTIKETKREIRSLRLSNKILAFLLIMSIMVSIHLTLR